MFPGNWHPNHLKQTLRGTALGGNANVKLTPPVYAQWGKMIPDLFASLIGRRQCKFASWDLEHREKLDGEGWKFSSPGHKVILNSQFWEIRLILLYSVFSDPCSDTLSHWFWQRQFWDHYAIHSSCHTFTFSMCKWILETQTRILIFPSLPPNSLNDHNYFGVMCKWKMNGETAITCPVTKILFLPSIVSSPDIELHPTDFIQRRSGTIMTQRHAACS